MRPGWGIRLPRSRCSSPASDPCASTRSSGSRTTLSGRSPSRGGTARSRSGRRGRWLRGKRVASPRQRPLELRVVRRAFARRDLREGTVVEATDRGHVNRSHAGIQPERRGGTEAPRRPRPHRHDDPLRAREPNPNPLMAAEMRPLRHQRPQRDDPHARGGGGARRDSSDGRDHCERGQERFHETIMPEGRRT